VHLLPGAVHAPGSEVVVGSLPGQEIVRRQPPSASSPECIEDGVQGLSGWVRSGASAGLGLGNEGLEDLPLVIRKVCGVGSSGGYDGMAPSRFGSRILRALTLLRHSLAKNGP